MQLVGCTHEQFRDHIASLFLPGMSFDNMNRWDLDHIIPCDAFDQDDMAQRQACWHYTNLRPLWSGENRSKNAKIPSWFVLDEYLEAFELFRRAA
jgi:hypothetical protein